MVSRWLQCSLRTALVALTTFAIWLLSRVDVQPTQYGIEFRRGNSNATAFVKRKLLMSAKQIDRFADAVRSYSRGGGCVELGQTERRLTIVTGEPASSWFHIWEPLQDVGEGHREEQSLLESLGPSLSNE